MTFLTIAGAVAFLLAALATLFAHLTDPEPIAVGLRIDAAIFASCGAVLVGVAWLIA